MNNSEIEVWWKRCGCISNPGVHTGEEVARDAEIRELREALISAEGSIACERETASYTSKLWNATNADRNACINELQESLALAQAEIKQWKANHDDVVKRCALLREREDLPVDRIPAYRELIRLQAIASEKSKVTPSDIAQGFEEFTLSLPKGAQKNVRDSQLRGGSVTYMAFIKGSTILGGSND